MSCPHKLLYSWHRHEGHEVRRRSHVTASSSQMHELAASPESGTSPLRFQARSFRHQASASVQCLEKATGGGAAPWFSRAVQAY
ncbi:hypothetical protein CCMA1212_004042 [Trichoderma ghanense]|uniref:Uncharacterized protein n=1 Tax=Trichoderma ghanense TaxID=65468 RepID=A0ABY2H8S2_9HYPO